MRRTAARWTRPKKLSSQLWLARQARDPYVTKRDEQGWAARSAFKLMELDDKLHVLKRGQWVLDVGAAPGGWTQVALRYTAAAPAIKNS
jgi:23S rRNA (uridine2552-2'-O)-methyltransferase